MRLPATAKAGLAVATVAAVLAVPSWEVSRAAVRATSGTCGRLLARHLPGVTTKDVARWTDATGDGRWSTAGNWTGKVPKADSKNVWVCVNGSSNAPSFVDQSFAVGGLEWGVVPLRICGAGDKVPCTPHHVGALSLWDHRNKQFSQLGSAATVGGSLSLCGGHDLHLSNGASVTNAGRVVLAGGSRLAGGPRGTLLNGKQGTIEYVDTGVSSGTGCTSGQTPASSGPYGAYITADFTNFGSVQVLGDGHPCPTDEYTGCDLLRVEGSPIKNDVDSGSYLVEKGAALSVDADRAMSGALKCAGQLWVTEASLTVPSGAQLNNCIVTVFTGNAGAHLLVRPGKTDIGTLDLAGGSVEAAAAQAPPGAREAGLGDSVPVVKILRLGLVSRPCNQETGAFCGTTGNACTPSSPCDFGPGLDIYLGGIIPEPYFVQSGSARTRHPSQLATHGTVTFMPDRAGQNATPNVAGSGPGCGGMWNTYNTTLNIGTQQPNDLSTICIIGKKHFVATINVQPRLWGRLTLGGADIHGSTLELLLTKPLKDYPAEMHVTDIVKIKDVSDCVWKTKALHLPDHRRIPARVIAPYKNECPQGVVSVTLQKP